jgi:hypothetical protein
MKIVTLLIALLISSCSTKPTTVPAAGAVQPEIRITEINPNKWTALTRQNLEHLIQIYNLAPLFFTYEIHIQSQVIPQSHPILILNTRYAENPHKLMSLLIHEQLHWWAATHKEKFDKAIVDLKILFPTLPKEGIAKDEHSTYLHLAICFLEYESMIHFVKKRKANKILKDYIQNEKIYPWIYSQVYLKYKLIEEIIKKYDLSPNLN